MKIRINELGSYIRNLILLEDDNDKKTFIDSQEHEKDASLDNQVDRYFAQYEKDSQQSDDLDEADDEEEKKELSIDNIDVESFANNVARLIENYDHLLEVRSTIARRAKNFLMKNYDSNVVDTFVSVMEDDFDISIDKLHSKDEKFPAAPADRAGPNVGGST